MIDLLFVPLYIILLWLQSRIREPFARSHAFFFLLFCPFLHFAHLATAEGTRTYSLDGNIAAHLVVLSYTALFFIGAIAIAGRLPQAGEISALANRVSAGTISIVLSAWLSIKMYLIAKYGMSAFVVLGLVAGDEKLQFIEPLDAALSGYAGYFAVGAVVAYAIRIVCGSIRWNHPSGILVAIFLFAYVVTGDTSLGARRFILLLVILSLSITLSRRYRHGKRGAHLYRSIILGAIIAGSFSIYYQTIRNNFYLEENAQRLLSGDPLSMIAAAAESLVPSNEGDVPGENQTQLRTGPFELLWGLSDRLINDNPTTKGEISWRSGQVVVPRLLLGERKESFSTDARVAEAFNMEPEGPYIEPDLPMTLLATFMADFGFVGALIAPLLMLLAIGLMSYALKRLGSISPIYVVVIFGAMFQTIGIVEGELIGYLAAIREFLALLMIASMIHVIVVGIREFVIYAIRSGRLIPILGESSGSRVGKLRG